MCACVGVCVCVCVYVGVCCLPADARVGRELFDRCVCGLLGSKTRILVTHQLQFLRSLRNIAVMIKGRIAAQGDYASLSVPGGLLRSILSSHQQAVSGATTAHRSKSGEGQPGSPTVKLTADTVSQPHSQACVGVFWL